MGNSDYRKFATLTELEADDLEGHTVAIDGSNFLYKYITTTVRFNDASVYTTSTGDKVPNLLGLTFGLAKLAEHRIKPIFVFDGKPHDLKTAELEKRRETKETAQKKMAEAKEKGDRKSTAKYEARTQRITKTITTSTQELLDAFNVTYMHAPQAAEAQAAHLVRTYEAQYVLSDDYDSLILGAPRTIRNFTSSSRPLECIQFQQTLDSHDISWEQLVDAAILCGTDYNDGISGVGPVTSIKIVKKDGGLDQYLSEKDMTIPNLNTIRDIYLNPNVRTESITSNHVTADTTQAEAVLNQWEIPHSNIEKALSRIEDAGKQPSLDDWM